MKSINKVGKPKSIRNIAYSILILFMIVASLTGATYAWFIASSANIENVFTAGTVKLSDPQHVVSLTEVTPGSNIAFVPNSGEASVSKVDLVEREEIARYHTAPREGDMVDLLGNPSDTANSVLPSDWRTSRIAQDADDNVWVINTGADRDIGLQGSIVRIQADIDGLGNTHEFDLDNPDSTPPLFFGTDDAVQVFPIGGQGDMPRAIAIDNEGYIWVGFYKGTQLMKYYYNEANGQLEVAGGPYGVGQYIRYYEMKFAPDGKLFISSRNSTPSFTPINTGIWTFDPDMVSDPNTQEFERETTFNPYSILISGTADNYNVYATAYNQLIHYRNSSGAWSNKTIPGTSNNRGMAFDRDGTIWVASTTGASGGNVIGWWKPLSDPVEKDFININTDFGNTPVGVGMDAAGWMWAICRSDNFNQGFIQAFNPDVKSGLNSVGKIQVGFRPYAYGDFSKTGSTCKTVEWEFEVTGTKSVYVRVKPTAELNNVRINLFENNSNWRKGSDGDEWWYYGSESGPLVIPPRAGNDSKVNVVFEYCIPDDSNPGFEVTLIAEAVQSTHGAIDTIWQTNPWR